MRRLLTILFLSALGFAQTPLTTLGAGPGTLTGGGPPPTGTPTLIQWVSSSSTTNNSTGTTVNSCPSHAYCFYLPNGTLAGNAIVGAVQFTGTPTPTVTDDASNTYSVIVTGADTNQKCDAPVNTGSGTCSIALFRAVNISSGARKITITFNTDTNGISAAAGEFNQIVTSSPDDGNSVGSSASGSSTISSGSITPGTSGDFIFHCGARSQTPKTNSFTVGASFSFMSSDSVDGLVCQWRNYPSTSPITPSLTMASNSGYATAAMALKTGNTGQARPAGKRIIGIAHYNEPAATSTATLKWQVPSDGANLIVGSFGFGGTNYQTASLADSSSNTWTHAALGQIGASSSGKSDIWYAVNPTVTNNLVITNTTSGTLSDYSALIYTMQGMATSSPLVNEYGHLRSSLTTSQVPYTMFFGYQIPPGVDDGILIGNLQQGFNTSQSVSGLCTTFDATTFGGENLSGGGTNPPDENNGWWHCDISAGTTGLHTIGQADAGTSLSGAAGQIAIFKSATANLTAILDTNFANTGNLTVLRTADSILWTAQDSRSGFIVTSNRAEPQSQSFDDGVLWIGAGSTVVWPNNQFSQCTLGTLTGTSTESGIGVWLRAPSNGTDNGYRVIVNSKGTTPNTWLSRFVSGVDTVIATGFKGSAWASGDIVYADVIDSGGNPVIRVRNGSGGSDIINFTDSSGSKILTGNAGMAFSSTVTASSCTSAQAGPK